MVTFCTTYLCYFMAETGGFAVSAVLSVLTLGILFGGFGATAIKTDEAHHMLHCFWTILCWTADTVIFVLAGVIIIQDGFLMHSEVFKGSDFGHLIALYGSLLVIRSLMILMCSPVLRYTGYGMQPQVCSPEKFTKYMCILSWGGLRGAVGLVLAVVVGMDKTLPGAVNDPDYCIRVLCHVAGVVILTTAINAMTLERLIVCFGLSDLDETDAQMKKRSAEVLAQKNTDDMRQFRNRHDYPELALVDWSSVETLVGYQALLPSTLQGMLTMTQEGKLEHDSAFRKQMPTNLGFYFQGQFLMALRLNYTSQTQGGLLSGLADRQISWAISKALAHVYDDPKSVESLVRELKNFEWGWLVEEGYLDLPTWLDAIVQALQDLPCLPQSWRARVVQYLTRRQHARRMEILLSVARAHKETLQMQSELFGDEVPTSARNLMNQSRKIQTLAEDKYAEMLLRRPDIARAVHTRQTCQHVLKEFNQQVQSLYEATQLSVQEFDHMRKLIVEKRRQLMYHLPPRKERADKKRTLMQLLHYITEEHLGDLKAGGLIAEEKFLAGETVLSTNQVADSIYVIQRGVVRQDNDICEDPENARMSPAGTCADAERKQVQLCARCCAWCGRARVWHMCSSICAHLN
jgi:NhaP-type Na+/H+ or K+/H+ antiporter